jgi:hypothetical protein
MKISLASIVAFALVSANTAKALVITPPGTPLAQSTFDSPPFTVGITVDGQGGSEPGWAAPWQKLGGFSDRGHVVSSPTYQGNGAVQLFADQIFGTSVEREWANIVPVVRVDSFVFVTPGASMNGQIVTATPASGEIDTRSAGDWQIEGNGLIDVFDKTTNGFVHTGFQTLPNQWNEYSLIADANTHSFSFLFNNQPFNSPHPLPFLNSTAYVDGINLRALGTLTSYADFVQVSAVPEPSSLILFAVGALTLGGLAVAGRRSRDAKLQQ